jgi:intracellular septation protein
MSQDIVVTVIVVSFLLLSWHWRPKQKAERWVWVLLAAFAFFGGWALWFGVYSEPGMEPDGYKLWKPTIFYWTLSFIMIAAPALGWGYPVKAIFGTFFALPNKQWRMMNWAFAALYVLLGSANLLFAFNSSEDEWIGFKFACMMNFLFLILFRVNFVWYPTLIEEIIKLYGRVKAFRS